MVSINIRSDLSCICLLLVEEGKLEKRIWALNFYLRVIIALTFYCIIEDEGIEEATNILWSQVIWMTRIYKLNRIMFYVWTNKASKAGNRPLVCHAFLLSYWKHTGYYKNLFRRRELKLGGLKEGILFLYFVVKP